MNGLILLTMHKTASTFFAKHFLPTTSPALGQPFSNPATDAWHRGELYADFSPLPAGVVGPIRNPIKIPDAAAYDDRAKLLVLRDPRDVLVSFYYSNAYSHPTGTGELAERVNRNRQLALEIGVDAYVLRTASAILDRYEDYRTRWVSRPNLKFMRYEHMVTAWPSFFREVGEFLKIPEGADWYSHMAALGAEFEPAPEDHTRHKRQLLPGDHTRKLKSETQTRLNDILAPALAWLGEPMAEDGRRGYA